MPKQVFVSPNGNGWLVKTVGASRAAGIYGTKAEAISKAREVAINNHAEMTVQNRDGKIAWGNSYGNDPHPPKG
jgi:hypothetical protein